MPLYGETPAPDDYETIKKLEKIDQIYEENEIKRKNSLNKNQNSGKSDK